MLGWCKKHNTEVELNFNCPCEKRKCEKECKSFINLITEDNKFDIDKKNELMYNYIIQELEGS